MEQNNKYGIDQTKTKGPKANGYLFMNISLAFILPLLSVFAEIHFEHEVFGWSLIGKWFIFWAVGIRLFTAGINQASNPKFTASIFRHKTTESFPIIRELGFANIGLGTVGILSVINDSWRLLAAVAGGLFLGLAGVQHLFKKPDTRNEVIAMLYDLCAVVVIILYLAFTLFIN